jgi:Transposase domain (DUF772)/Transposase DDE domain
LLIGDTPVRVVDVFVDELKLHQLGFDGVKPAATGRPSYHPAVLLKVYIYGYLNQVQSSRRLERGAPQRRISRWEHEDVLEVIQARLDGTPKASRLRQNTVERVFGTLKAWMGYTHFLSKTLPCVRTEMSLQVLAYNLRRVIKILGTEALIAQMRT